MTAFDTLQVFQSMSRSPNARLEHCAELGDGMAAALGEVMRTRTTAQWLAALEQADIPAMPVHDLDSIFTDPHLVATAFFGREAHPSEGELLMMRHPAQWSRTQPASPRPAPGFGEHTVEVMREAGFTEAEIASLRPGHTRPADAAAASPVRRSSPGEC